jgi:hypothetical protein
MSTITLLEFSDKLNVWRTESHAMINVETALLRIVKINASLNTITALLSLAQLAVSMWEINVLLLVVHNALLKTGVAWTTVPMNTIIALVSLAWIPAWIIGSIDIFSALSTVKIQIVITCAEQSFLLVSQYWDAIFAGNIAIYALWCAITPDEHW